MEWPWDLDKVGKACYISLLSVLSFACGEALERCRIAFSYSCSPLIEPLATAIIAWEDGS